MKSNKKYYLKINFLKQEIFFFKKKEASNYSLVHVFLTLKTTASWVPLTYVWTSFNVVDTILTPFG